jgi:hypothetical protein
MLSPHRNNPEGIILISRNDIIIKYQITNGQINYAVKRTIWPKTVLIKKHNEVFYNENDILKYFEKHPIKPSKRSYPKIRNRKSIFSSNIPPSAQTKENKRIDEFNRMAVTFNIQKRRENKIEIDINSIHNKYNKTIKHKVIKLSDLHEQTTIRNIDPFYVLHDVNHRLVI